MGFFKRFKKVHTKNSEYEQPYSHEIHSALKNIDRSCNDSFSIEEAHFSMEYIKKQEIEQPTHWIYKYVVDPIEMNYRTRALRKSMIGQYDEVITICEKGLEKYPDNPYLLYMQGRTLGDIGKVSNNCQKLNKGIEVLNHVINLYPNFADAYVERGRIKKLQTDNNGAIEDFTIANNIEPGITDFINKTCYMCGKSIDNDCNSVKYPGISKGSYELTDPKYICQTCLDQMDDSDHTYEYAEFVICIEKNEIDKAIQILKSIFNNINEMHWYNLGNLYFRKNMKSEALDCYDQALFLNTAYIKAWYRKGSILMTQENFFDACKCFKNIRNLDQNNDEGWNSASAFCLLICSVVIHNKAVQTGKSAEVTDKEVQKWIMECKPVWEYAIIREFNVEKSGIDGFIDFCFENYDSILDYLEPSTGFLNTYPLN